MQKRLACIDDIPVLVELRKRLLIEEGASPPTSDIDGRFAEGFAAAIADGSFVGWVVEAGGGIVATGGACFYSLLPSFANPSGKVAYIANMYVKPEYRRKGLATELLGMALEEARRRGCEIARLHSSEHAKSIYVKAGFTDSGGYMALKI